MKRVCSWCKADLGEVPGNPDRDAPITHGICLKCADKYFSLSGTRLLDFLDEMSVPVLIVNRDGTIETANLKAQQMLGKDLPRIRGYRGGDVFECAYASLPEGCGETIHCSGCTIRRAVMRTFETGQNLPHEPAYLNRRDQDSIRKIKFVISTERVNGYVLLRIEDVGEASAA